MCDLITKESVYEGERAKQTDPDRKKDFKKM
jgi:hypothetical protein